MRYILTTRKYSPNSFFEGIVVDDGPIEGEPKKKKTRGSRASDPAAQLSAETPAEEAVIADDVTLPKPEEQATADAVDSETVDPETKSVILEFGLGYGRAAARVKEFPHKPGVYLMKDSTGRVIYIGKAKDLRNRASSYFLKVAAVERRTAELVREICDIDYIECDSEVDALLAESRLIKDIQPKFNQDLKDDKSFPYLEIFVREDFPRVEFTREPQDRGTKLYGPFASAGSLRGAIAVLQKVFKFRTCSLDIAADDDRWRWFRPCLLASIDQCTAPCNMRISKEEYRKDIDRLRMFLDGNKKKLLTEMRAEMAVAAKGLLFEKAGRLRDEIRMLETLDDRGELDTHEQPEVFFIDPKKGLAGLKKVLGMDKTPRTIEGVDIAHLQGGETVASLVQFIDGLPFKPGYKRYKIRSVTGIDDFASIHEVVARRFKRLEDEGGLFPDILLIDGGKGQLNAGLAAFRALDITPPTIISLAKREEEIYIPGADEPLRLSRHAYALRLLQYVRDEAHRFAQHYHHMLRRKTTFGDDTK
ncbi:MAG: excinuclease ABC subunit UvrC [Planctomycetia bacterium]|nr:excinuclease ABC subunit UvrC [Planctomycetia bacterium]